MTAKTKAALQTEIATLFLDNTTGLITPTSARTMYTDMVDSWLAPLDPETITSTGAPQLTLNGGGVDAVLLHLTGPTHTVQVAENGNGGFLRVFTSGSLSLGTAGSDQFRIGATGGLVSVGLSDKGTGTINASGIFGPTLNAGTPGSTPGAVKIAGSNATSNITLAANASGASYTMTLPPSAGSAGQLLGTDGAAVTNWVNGGQVLGDASGAAASSGRVGEVVFSEVLTASAISAASGSPVAIASLSLSAGDWNVWGAVGETVTASFVGQVIFAGVQPTASFGALSFSRPRTRLGIDHSGALEVFAPIARYLVSTTTPVFLVGQEQFTAGAVSLFGFIAARRMR